MLRVANTQFKILSISVDSIFYVIQFLDFADIGKK